MSFIHLIPVVGTFCILFSSFLHAEKLSITDSLQAVVSSQLTAHFAEKLPQTDITIDINSINEAVNYRKCTNLIIPMPKDLPSGGRVTLRVACTEPNTWYTYVVAKVSAYANVAYTTRAIAKNRSITAKDIKFTRDNLATLNQGYFRDPAQVIGLKTKRFLTPNTLLTPQLLEAPLLVHKGDGVIIQAKKLGLTIRTQGIALEDGSFGEQISIMNSRSQKTIRAYVVSRGVVSTAP